LHGLGTSHAPYLLEMLLRGKIGIGNIHSDVPGNFTFNLHGSNYFACTQADISSWAAD
jgi:hypothetical protein